MPRQRPGPRSVWEAASRGILPDRRGKIGRLRPKQCGGRVEPLAGEPAGRKAVAAVRREQVADGGVVGLRRRGREGERDLAQAELEQAIALAGLAVVVALGRCPGEDFDLAVIEAEAA